MVIIKKKYLKKRKTRDRYAKHYTLLPRQFIAAPRRYVRTQFLFFIFIFIFCYTIAVVIIFKEYRTCTLRRSYKGRRAHDVARIEIAVFDEYLNASGRHQRRSAYALDKM